MQHEDRLPFQRIVKNTMKTLLLLHGALGAAAQFEALETALSDTFTIMTLNFSGHGGREIPADGYSMELFVGDIASLLAAEGIDRAHIFGYSMGGYAALTLAARRPERVAAVMTLATKFRWSEEIARKEVAMLNPAVLREKVPAFAAALAARHAPQPWEEVVTQTAAMMNKLGANPLLTSDSSSALDIPVRLMLGDRDSMVSLDETAEFYRALPKGSLAVLPATPHPFEKADVGRLAREITEFFGE